MPDPCETPEACQEYSAALVQVFQQRTDDLAQQLIDGNIDIGAWQVQMREELRQMNAMQLIAGAGGDKANVASDDWLVLGNELKTQYGYLEDFSHAIADGDLTDAQIQARARLYAASTKASYWREFSEADLPHVPGDGSTVCLGNCDCTLSFEYEYDEEGNITSVLVTWNLGETDSGNHCPDCEARAEEWNPLRIELNSESEEE